MILALAAVVYLTIFNSVAYGSSDSECDNMECSFLYDPVCGVTSGHGATVVSRFDNLCQLYKTKCILSDSHGVERVPDRFCGIKKPRKKVKSGRRLNDFGIIGAAQECSHSCPTSCIDTYEPVCAKIYHPLSKQKYSMRTMVNHCHVDMFSCVHARNVSIMTMNYCVANSRPLEFMKNVAAMKSLGLIYNN